MKIRTQFKEEPVVNLNEPEAVTLSNLSGGAAEEKFAEKLREVIENIEDVNTLAKTKREIVIRVTFSPSEERDVCAVGIYVEASLAANKPTVTTVFVGRKNGVPTALESNPKQQALFNDQPARPVGVVDPSKGA